MPESTRGATDGRPSWELRDWHDRTGSSYVAWGTNAGYQRGGVAGGLRQEVSPDLAAGHLQGPARYFRQSDHLLSLVSAD